MTTNSEFLESYRTLNDPYKSLALVNGTTLPENVKEYFIGHFLDIIDAKKSEHFNVSDWNTDCYLNYETVKKMLDK